MLILALDTHFFHWIGCQQGSNLCLNGPIEARHDNCVAHLEQSIDKDHINGGAVAFNHLDLQDCALEHIFLGEVLALRGLAHTAQLENQI